MAQLKDLLVTGAARFLNGLYGDLNGNVLNYGECTTAEATNTKTVTTNGVFELQPGSEVAVKFTNGNSASSPTLNVNGLGAKNIYLGTSVAPAAAIQKGYTYLFKYDGTNWQILGPSVATRLGTDEVGGTTLPVYIQSGGIVTPTSYALKATVNAGTATRVAYYSGANAISAGSATSDGSYFGNVAYLSVNEAHLTSYRLKVNGTSFFNDDITLGSSGTRAIKYKGTNQTFSMIRFLDNTADSNGNGISIGGGGIVVIGSGESATNFSVSNGGTETTYLLSDNAIYLEANGLTIANRIGASVNSSGNFVPVKAEANNNNALSLGVSGNRWKAAFIGSSDTYGSTAKGVYWNAGVPTPLTYSLNSNVSTGTANKIAWYTANNTIGSGTITTNGAYLSNISYLTVNDDNQSTYRLYVTGNSYFSDNGIFASTTESTSTATGALVVSGGVGIAKNLYVGNNLFANTSGNLISNITYYTGESNAGKTYINWVKFASYDMNTSNHFGNLQFDIFINRSYNSPSSEVYAIRVNIGWGSCNIVQLGSSIGTQIIPQFRVAKDNTNHKVYFEYYVTPTYTTSQNTVHFKIIKYHGSALTLLNEVLTEEDTSFANIYTLNLTNGTSSPRIGTANKIAYYSATDTINSGSIDTDGSYLRNIGGYSSTSYALSANSAIINDWIRTVGNTGWYNQTHGGGWYMPDNNWIRMYANKQVAITSTHATSANNLSSQLVVGSVGFAGADMSGGDVAIELWRGTNASWQIVNTGGYLTFKNNYTSSRQTTYSKTSLTLDYNTGAGSIPYLAIGLTNRNTTYKLYVNGNSYFNGLSTAANQIYVSTATNSTSTTTGAIVTAGGIGVGKDVYIGLKLTVVGETNLSTTTISAPLTVTSSSTFSKPMSVTSSSTFSGPMSVTSSSTFSAPVSITSTLSLSGPVKITSTTESTSTTTGALVVSGGVGIAKNIYIGGHTYLSSSLTVKNTATMRTINPEANATYNLGSTSTYWNGAWIWGNGNIHWNNLINTDSTAVADPIITTQTGRGLIRIFGSNRSSRPSNVLYGVSNDAVTVEFTTDGGTTWENCGITNLDIRSFTNESSMSITPGLNGAGTNFDAYDATTTASSTGGGSGVTYAANFWTNKGVRVTIDLQKENRCGNVDVLYLRFGTASATNNKSHIIIERQHYNGTWTTIKETAATRWNSNDYNMIVYPNPTFYMAGTSSSATATYCSKIRVGLIVDSWGTAYRYAPRLLAFAAYGWHGSIGTATANSGTEFARFMTTYNAPYQIDNRATGLLAFDSNLVPRGRASEKTAVLTTDIHSLGEADRRWGQIYVSSASVNTRLSVGSTAINTSYNFHVTGSAYVSAASYLNGDTIINGILTLNKFSRALTSTYSIATSAWSSALPCTASISVSGITASDKPIISMFIPATENAANYKAMWKAYGCIDKAVSGTNQIIFYCYNKKPAADIRILVKGI